MSEEAKVGSEATTENKATVTDDSKPVKEKTIAEEAEIIPAHGKGEGDASESLAESSKEDKSSEAEATDDVEDIIESIKQTKKSGSQKRIDKLVALNAELTERLTKLENNTSEGKPAYTPAQIRAALKKGLEEGDHDLIADIMDYQVKSATDKLEQKYRDEQKKAVDSQKAIATEWTETVDAYGYLSDPKQPELYPGSHDELNIKNNSSYLFKQASRLYNSADPELSKYYHQAGGQKLAITDALTYIIRQKGGVKSNSKETKRLENKLAKEKRKNSLAAPGAEKADDEAPKKPLSDKERVEDIVRERKAAKDKKMFKA